MYKTNGKAMKSITILTIILSMFFYQNIKSQEMKVMTYNIRYDDFKDTETSWSQRKDLLGKQLKFYNPDIFGTQEGLINQLQYIDIVLTDHQYVGVGRDDGKIKGEFCSIFYNFRKFKVIKQSTFWLSPTPDTVSMGWGSKFNRICTYALFQNIESKKFLWVFNAHFNHIADLARENSAKLIIERINSLNVKQYPVILMGDLNLEPQTAPIQYLSSVMNDSRFNSPDLVFGNEGTFNGFEFNKPLKSRIDYIFTSKDKFKIRKYAVLSDSKNCMYPSDHLPVYVEMVVK